MTYCDECGANHARFKIRLRTTGGRHYDDWILCTDCVNKQTGTFRVIVEPSGVDHDR